MTNISLNQTESEKRLHRILYYVKVLRAATLNLVLISLAIVLYMVFGISGLYPMAEDTINFLRPHMDDSERYAYILMILITLLLGIAIVVWFYVSIVRVWRKSLKAQVIFGVIFILISPLLIVLEFLFNYHHLDLLFTILLGTYWAFSLWWSVDITVGLWKVSTSPEVYSFTATMDPRLTEGIWVHFNKLLDLPRTPLKTWRTGSAYLLALGSYILLIACLEYFVTFGGVSSKLGQLRSATQSS